MENISELKMDYDTSKVKKLSSTIYIDSRRDDQCIPVWKLNNK